MLDTVQASYMIRRKEQMGNVKHALFGATGAVGKALAAKLAERGQSFRVVGRSEERLRRDFSRGHPVGVVMRP
jgi:short-subunit dehydrogenase